MPLYYLPCSSNLKTEVICSPETYVDLQRTTWRFIPDDRTILNHRCENPNFHLGVYVYLFFNYQPILQIDRKSPSGWRYFVFERYRIRISVQKPTILKEILMVFHPPSRRMPG
jgi:hypothetical protein